MFCGVIMDIEENLDFMTFEDELLKTTSEAKELALEYLNSRKLYNHCFNQLVVLIQKAGLHQSKKSLDNKISELLGDTKYGEKAQQIYEQMLTEEANYKGLEVVCKAYANHSVALCAIMKQQTNGEIAQGLKDKYSQN